MRAYPGLRIDVATDVDHVLEGLCASRRHGQLRVAMGAQKGGVPSRRHRGALSGQGVGFGVPVKRRTAKSVVRIMLRIGPKRDRARRDWWSSTMLRGARHGDPARGMTLLVSTVEKEYQDASRDRLY